MSAIPNSSSENNNAAYSVGGDNGEGAHAIRAANTSSHPWSRIVRGDSDALSVNIESDCVHLKSSCSTISLDAPVIENRGVGSTNMIGNDNVGVKLAWNKLSNGTIAISPVMGAVSWPALSDSVKVGSKSPSDSSKSFADGSSLSSQGSVPSASSSSPKKQSTSNNSSITISLDHTVSPRSKYNRRSGAGGPASNGPSQPLIPSSVGVGGTNPTPVNHMQKNSNWDQGQRAFPVQNPIDNPLQPAPFRRGIGGFHPRVDGSYSHNYGVRYEHDRVYNNDWNPHRNHNGRDSHVQPQRIVAGAFYGPSPHYYPYVHPFPFRAFGSPMGFEMASQMMYIPPESYRGVPFIAPIPSPVPVPVPVPVPLPLPVPVTPPTSALMATTSTPTSISPPSLAPAPLPVPVQHPPVLPHSPDPELYSKVVKQISYYFSVDNLVKDTYLRENMDEQGWVPIEVVSKFKILQNMTEDIPFILEAVRNSNVVEVQDNKVRKHGDWKKWIIPQHMLSVLSPRTLLEHKNDMLISGSGNMRLEDERNHDNSNFQHDASPNMAFFRDSSFGDDQNQASGSGDRYSICDTSCSGG